MLKEAGIEETKVSDPSGGKISVSTTARLAFRKAWPDKAGARNAILNDFIANMFAGGTDSGSFTPRDGGGEGKVRAVQGGRFIAIASKDGIRVIAVKGSVPELPELPESYKPPSLGGTSISDHKDPGGGSSSSSGAPAAGGGGSSSGMPESGTGSSSGTSGPVGSENTPPAKLDEPKHHIIPYFPGGGPQAPASQPAPIAPPPPPIVPITPMPAAPAPAMPAPVAPAPPTPESKPGLMDRLKQFIGYKG